MKTKSVLTARQKRIVRLAMKYRDRIRESDRPPLEYALDQVINGATEAFSPGRPVRSETDIKLLTERIMVERIRSSLTEREYTSIAPRVTAADA